MYVRVDVERARMAGRTMSKAVSKLPVDPFTDPRFYPPEDADRETVTMYFLVMVAMDHRLSRPGKPYEALVKGRRFHGADLLYRLGALKLEEDPKFFTAERLARVSEREVEEWLSVGEVKPPDVEVRAKLLRDIGSKLLSIYGGSAYRVIVESKGYLRRGVGEGLIDRLKVFTAYQDPVEKKAFLLAKFLERRGVVRFLDSENKEVPVDNHLVRIALRLGIVSVDRGLMERIRSRAELDWREDVILRLAVREAYKIVAEAGGIDPFILDDFLWMFGRKCCTRENPVCRAECREGCAAIGGCDGGCILSGVCKAYSSPIYMLPEHMFLRTWWY
ncbi:MAG: hypothetical protein F7B17_05510 [Desulfurococcales archaeon]|nr:hypothetical protein [Desulfurococcales archaeon]